MAQVVTALLMGDPPPGRAAQAPPSTPSVSVSLAPAMARLCNPVPASPPGTPALGSEEKGPAPFPVEIDSANDKAAETLRPVEPVNAAGLKTTTPPTGEPIFERVDPRDLLVDEAYQRALSERSMRLIRRIVEHWDWRRFKPPVVALTARGLEVIDGQHTAIAAATHPDIGKIPVMVVEAPEVAARAAAFVGHNTDRLGVTAMQVHIANVAAGADDALTIERATSRAGAELLRTAPSKGWEAGQTVAINAIGALVHRRGEDLAADLLGVLVECGCAPVTAAQIKAVEHILADEETSGLVERADLVKAIGDIGFLAEREAREFAAIQGVPMWKGLVHVWLKKCRKRRKS